MDHRFDLRIALALTVTTVAACGCGMVNGSGVAKTETRPVAGVTAVSLAGSGRLEIDPGATETLAITADDNILPLLVAEVKDGRLRLGSRDGASYSATTPIVFKLGVRVLGEMDLSGSGDVVARGLSGVKLVARISGSGSMTAAGKVDELAVEVSGSGAYRGEGLESRAATADLSGSGSATLNVTSTLDAKVSGAGVVEYFGSPTVTEKISGSGAVRKR